MKRTILFTSAVLALASMAVQADERVVKSSAKSAAPAMRMADA